MNNILFEVTLKHYILKHSLHLSDYVNILGIFFEC